MRGSKAASNSRRTTSVTGRRTPAEQPRQSPTSPPGKYDLHIDYIPVPGGGGTVEIRDLKGSTVVRIGGATREKRGPLSTKVGTITLPRQKTVTLRVAPRSVSDRGLFLLTQMRLVATAK